jgi:hypothetical protein
MPNHIHGIVEIVHQKLAQQAAPEQRPAGRGPVDRRTPSLSIIVRSFKADVTRRIAVAKRNLAAQLFRSSDS